MAMRYIFHGIGYWVAGGWVLGAGWHTSIAIPRYGSGHTIPGDPTSWILCAWCLVGCHTVTLVTQWRVF